MTDLILPGLVGAPALTVGLLGAVVIGGVGALFGGAPDNNPAVGMAVANFRGETTRYPICAAHLASLGQVHHGKCHHVSTVDKECFWTFEPLESEVA